MPRRYPNPPGPPGERRVSCDYCGFWYYRTTMSRDSQGLLVCSDGCDSGLSAYDLDRANAAAAQSPPWQTPSGDYR